MPNLLETSTQGPPELPEFFQNAVRAARGLLGWIVVRRDGRGGLRSGRIVETEAYPHDDPACHAFRGRTERNASMFREAGHAYVYRIHRSYCLNVVTGPPGQGEAVLIRALEPLEGIARMERARRRLSPGRCAPPRDQLTNGPGKLCQALEIDTSLDGCWLFDPTGPLCLVPGTPPAAVACSTRIGISKARDERLRFYEPHNPWVSR
ncbi:MAG: DNA-3-methyladenine glycosylase [Candidatus Dadabacteria bacterium]|nr:MAG: DNA-3-methyladenine glycosylase [Candidatus Dadabacteria bacterium]